MNLYKTFFKRFIDFIVALMGLILLSPVIIIVSIFLYFDFNGNPFFKQKRPGRNERVFEIIKFKTMNDKRDSNGQLLPDNQRITILGQFIRKSSLDEIPQLINVLKGDMSLIGPRPLRTFYLPYYNDNERIRHNVRPGITGLAQVSGRNFLSWEERFKFDIEYVKTLSFSLDLDIILKTAKKAFSGKDVAEDPFEFTESFDVYRKKQLDL